MSDEKKKLTPQQLKQIEELQKLIVAKAQERGLDSSKLASGGKMKPSRPKKPSLWTPKGLFIAMLQIMQNSVKFIDYFINFIIKKDKSKNNDVVEAARSPVMFGVFVTIFFVITGFIWAATAPLDSAAYSIGTLISNSKKRVINHPEGGIVKKIYVTLGDHVQEGDPLIEFDQTRIRADYESNLNQYRNLLASEQRLLAEINNQPQIAYPEFILKDRSVPYVTTLIQTQDNLLRSKIELKTSEKQSIREKIKQIDKEIEGLNAKITAFKKTYEVTEDRLEATAKLHQQGFVQKAVLLELEAKLANAEGEIASSEAKIASLKQDIVRTEIELINLDSKYSANALNELKETQIQLAQTKEKFFAYEDALRRIVIRAPVTGIINNLNFFTVGSSIPPQQTILEVSPDEDDLVIEARIDPRYIDSVHVGLQSKIRFSAFKSRTTPLFIGQLVSLSPDIVLPPQAAPGDPLANGYYIGKIELDMEEFEKIAKVRGLKLVPGMQAEVQIVTGTRTLLKYLLDPVLDAIFKGFKEK